MKALVLDAQQRSALAATRSLGRAGLVVVTADASRRSLAGASRYSSSYLQSPDPERHPKAYLEWLEELLRRDSFDLVLPVTEITSQLLLMHRERWNDLPMPFADYGTVMSLADKGQLMTLAEQLGIPHPASQRLASASAIDWESIQYPVVIKPCLSKIYEGDSWVATSVRVAQTRDELKGVLEGAPYLYDYPFMLQEFVPGRGAGVFCIYDRGRPLAVFAHRRVREKPPEGGVSVLSESVDVDPGMAAYAGQLLKTVNWHGAAMVEFRVSPDGTPYLMEVNTRLWGSLQLAIDSGVDFPRLLWNVQRGTASPGPVRYRVGQRLRWVLGDLDALYLYLKGRYTIRQKFRRVMQFMTPRFRHCRHEVNRWGDLRPALYEIKQYFKQLMGQ